MKKYFFYLVAISLLSIFIINIPIFSKNLNIIPASDELKYKVKKYIFPYRLNKTLEKKILNFKKETKDNLEFKRKVQKQLLLIEKNIKLSNNNIVFIKSKDSKLNINNKIKNISHYQTSQILYGMNNIFPGSAYLDFYEDKLFLVSSTGIIGFSNNIQEDKIIFKQIKNNISKFIDDKDFYKNEWFSIKDVLISDNKIYISYTNQLNKDCYNTSILSAEINLDYLNFKYLFNPNECVKIFNEDDVFNAHQSGGRIAELDNKNLLFTVGEYRLRYKSQESNSVFGKLLKINKFNGKYEIVSLGHRNPQGLHYDKKKKLILMTEHGPAGGDEINFIKNEELNSKKNFGWPIASYGKHYGGQTKKNSKYPLKKSHSNNGFAEPLQYFVPSIGISQIEKIGQNKYIFGSMRNKMLYEFDFLDQKNEIINLKEIYKDERIRDLIYVKKNEKIFIFFEDTASIGVIDFY